MVAEMTDAALSRHADFERLLRAAARELRLPRTHATVRRLATVRLQRQALAEVQERDLLNGKLSDPSKLLDADDRLRAEEDRLVALAPRDAGAPSIIIQPVRLVERTLPEVKLPVVALRMASPDASANAGVLETADAEERTGDVPNANEPPSKSELSHRYDKSELSNRLDKSSNVVALDRNRSRDIHHGEHAVLKSETSRDPSMGGFTPKGQT